ncbi:reverse transcriptase [Rhizoctonia solani 123E]|uniref:Reverse transcriptase n=1 Tax=Rhizoctonia solani 123E TaxID=1423351 RepID=A0A074S581_9AGAM|nr:reverse transcriptase [Rhizoctonia solani 123E]
MSKLQESTKEDWILTTEIEHLSDSNDPEEDPNSNSIEDTKKKVHTAAAPSTLLQKPALLRNPRRIQLPVFEIQPAELKVEPKIDIKPYKNEGTKPIALSPSSPSFTGTLLYPPMSTVKPTYLKPIAMGSEDIVSHKRSTRSASTKTPFFQLNKDTSRHPEQVGCLNTIPVTYEDACYGPDWEKWMPAYNKELNAFWEKDVWSFAPRPEDKLLTVDSQLIFNIKHDKHGNPHTYKVCIVAKGFTQQYGVNYAFTNSPTPSLDIIRTLMAVAVHENLDIHQVNVSSAFLNAPLDEDNGPIYMEVPPGYDHPKYPRKDFMMHLNKAVMNKSLS